VGAVAALVMRFDFRIHTLRLSVTAPPFRCSSHADAATATTTTTKTTIVGRPEPMGTDRLSSFSSYYSINKKLREGEKEASVAQCVALFLFF